MSEVIQTTQQEFWRPPSHALEQEVAPRQSVPVMAESCPRCGTEFLLGSRFCHSCGKHRPEAISASTRADAAALAKWWMGGVRGVQSALEALSWSNLKGPQWMGYVHFHEMKDYLGLSTGTLIAFVAGIACIAGALLAGLLTVKTWNDFQAIQYYRLEWLLGATASFVAGILLKKPSRD